MKTITLRNLPPEITKAIQQRAKQHKTSVNNAVIGLLEESVGRRPGKKEKVRHHDLDHLAGTWTKGEADAFDKIIKSFQKIEKEKGKGARLVFCENPATPLTACRWRRTVSTLRPFRGRTP